MCKFAILTDRLLFHLCSVVCAVSGGRGLVEVWSVSPGHHVILSQLNISQGTVENTREITAEWVLLNSTRCVRVFVCICVCMCVYFYIVSYFSCIRTRSSFVCVDTVAMDIHWLPLTQPLPPSSSFHTSSLLHLLPSSSHTPSLTLNEAAGDLRVWLSLDGHTHLLLDLAKNNAVSVVTTLMGDLPFLGVLDDSGEWEGHTVDMRIGGGGSRDDGRRELVLSYSDDGGVEREAGRYAYTEERGRPLIVSVRGVSIGVWSLVCLACRLQFSCTQGQTRP